MMPTKRIPGRGADERQVGFEDLSAKLGERCATWNPASAGLVMAACLWIAVPIAVSAALAQPGLVVEHRARSLRPGEVVMLTVVSRRPLREVSLGAFGRSFLCFEAGGPRKWVGLVGIDLDTAPGRYAVEVRGTDGDGQAVSAEHPLWVRSRKFETRSLTVDERFVSPPPEALARIQSESERVRAIFDAASPDRYWKGPFIRPVPGPPISSFGKRSVYNGQPRSSHSGTDFSGATGTPIEAPNTGKVVLAGNLYYSGNTVILDHGQGLYSYLGHMSEIAAQEGDVVAAGDVVGRVGATGRVTGPHLHWSVRLAGTRVDPLSLIAVLKTAK